MGEINFEIKIYEIDDSIGGTGLLIYRDDHPEPKFMIPLRDASIRFASPLRNHEIVVLGEEYRPGTERFFVAILDANSCAVIRRSESRYFGTGEKYLVTRDNKHLF